MASRRAFSPQTICVLAVLCAEPSVWRHGCTLAKQTGLKPGTLYPILVRLADRGLVEGSWEDEHVPGRPRRHRYRLTADGLAAAATAAIPQTTAARECAAPRGRKPARLAARAAVPWTGWPAGGCSPALVRSASAGRARGMGRGDPRGSRDVPAGCQRLAWLGGGLRMVSGESMIMRKAGAICAFAVAVGCIASLSWPQSAVNRVTVANRVSLLLTVALLVGLWVAGRRLVGPARAGRAQRLVRAGGYSAVLALTLCKVSVERMRGPESLGPGAGGLLWTGEALFLLMMAIFTAVVIMATAQRSPVTTGTLLRGIAAGLPIGIAVFVFLPLGVVRYQASRVLPAVPEGALGALAWTVVLVAPAVAGVLAARRFDVRPGTAACGGSGFRGWRSARGRRSRCTGRARTARPKARREYAKALPPGW